MLTSMQRPSGITWLVAPGLAMIAVTYGLARFAYGLFLPEMRESLDLSESVLGLIGAALMLATASRCSARSCSPPALGHALWRLPPARWRLSAWRPSLVLPRLGSWHSGYWLRAAAV